MTDKKKAKRVLFNFDFDTEGAHVALVSKQQGGAANGRTVLVTKSVNQGIRPHNPIKVQKALEQIIVTLSMEEFLRKFFDMWYDDAETLTKLLGFETEFEANKKEREANGDSYDWEKGHEDWMSQKLSKFQLMKSLHESPNQAIEDEDFIALTILQERVEKSLSKYEEERQMATNATTVTIEKARFSELEGKETELTVAVQKAADLQSQVEALTLQLTKAAEDKVAAEFTAFSESIKDLVEASQLEKVAKSLFTLKGTDEEAANIMIETLKAKKSAVEGSDLFVEKSHAEEVETQTPEQIRKAALKAEINKPL